MGAGSTRAAVMRMFARRRVRIWIIAALMLGVGLGFVPLFEVLGYELAIVAALFGSVMGLDIGAALARELQWSQASGVERASYAGRALARSIGGAVGLAVAIVLVPAVIAAVRGIWRPTCDWAFGIEAYAVMPLASCVLAAALGHVIGVAVGSRAPDQANRDRTVSIVFAAVLGLGIAAVVLIAGAGASSLVLGLGISIVLGTLLWFVAPHRSTLLAIGVPVVLLAASGLWRFYSAPPVFTYNALIGYFPGNLYDENIELGAPLLWSRLEQLAWVIAIASLVAWRLDVPRFRWAREARPAKRRLGALALALVFAAAATTLRLDAGQLGYAITGEEIADELGGRLETEHFIIHYANTPEIERDIQMIAADHELRYAQVVAQLGMAPAGKLRSFYFANREQKSRWMGAKDVEMAKPWRHEIYLEHRAFPHGSLRHEIAHAVASSFGDPIFGVASRPVAGVPLMASPGLIEGLAVAADWPAGYDRLTPHESVRAMQEMGWTPTIRELLSLRFLTVSSARSYTTAGSFLKYLLDTYGASSLRKLYGNGGDFIAAYGKTLPELEAEWRAMIGAIVLPKEVVEGTRERFRGGSVFARPCPHANAARRQRAVQALAAGDRPTAVSLMREVCKDAPEEPRYRLELGDFLGGGDELERAQAIVLWTSVARGEAVTSSLKADAIERLARIASMEGDTKHVIELIGEARALGVDPNARRQLEAEWFALHHDGAAAGALQSYFFPPLNVAVDAPTWAMMAALAEPDLGFGFYLLGLQLTNAADWHRSAVMLGYALERGLPDISFVRNGARKLAVAAYRSHDLALVEQAISTLRGPGMSESDRLLADDWAQRLRFDADGHL